MSAPFNSVIFVNKGSKHTKETKAKIAKAMEGNSNSEKWTETLVTQVLEDMVKYAKTPISDTETVHLKKELLVEFEIWNSDWFNQMAKKFSDSKTVLRLLHACAMICEVNSYKAAATNKANPMMAKFNLATHYNWSDKSTVLLGDKDKERTDDELNQDIEDYEKRNKK